MIISETNEKNEWRKKNKIHVSYIKALNETILKGLESIRLGDLLYSELWYMLNKDLDQVEEDIKTLLNKSCFSTKYKKGEDDRLLLLSYYRGRLERDNYWRRIVSLFPNASEIVAHDLRKSNESDNSLSANEQDENQTLFDQYLVELKTIETELYRRYLAAFLVVQKRWLTHIEKRLSNKKVLLCYFDGGFFENIAVQTAKNAQIFTVSCQHGQPIFQSKEYDLINQAQILNFKSDYFIATNSHTVKQFEAASIDLRRIVLLGCFKDVHEFTKDRLASNNKLCLFLDSSSLPFALETNKEMIRFVQDFAYRANCQVSIKPHPSNRPYEIHEACKNNALMVFSPTEALDRCLDGVGIAICHASSVYLDLCEKGIKTFVWESDIYNYPITDLRDECVFSVEELISKMGKWEKIHFDEKATILNNIRNHTLNAEGAKERFVSFVKKLLDES